MSNRRGCSRTLAPLLHWDSPGSSQPEAPDYRLRKLSTHPEPNASRSLYWDSVPALAAPTYLAVCHRRNPLRTERPCRSCQSRRGRRTARRAQTGRSEQHRPGSPDWSAWLTRQRSPCSSPWPQAGEPLRTQPCEVVHQPLWRPLPGIGVAWSSSARDGTASHQPAARTWLTEPQPLLGSETR